MPPDTYVSARMPHEEAQVELRFAYRLLDGFIESGGCQCLFGDMVGGAPGGGDGLTRGLLVLGRGRWTMDIYDRILTIFSNFRISGRCRVTPY